MNIAFISKNFPGKYSGGRIHAWMMAEAIASNGYELDFYTDNQPVFYNDFSEFPGHRNIKLLINKFFNFKINKKYDLIILVPHLASSKSFVVDRYLFNPFIKRMARFSKGKVLMLDFESPNWAMKYIDTVRTLADYRYSDTLIKYVDVILSTTKVGLNYAREYYQYLNPRLTYKQLYVSINSVSANKIGFLKKRDQIIYFGRFKEKYKGSNQFLNIVNSIPAGYTLTVIGNKNELQPEILREISSIEKSNSIVVSFEYRINDLRKYTLISQSKLLLFNSDFEGYGLPPIEAQYLGTEVLCSELPVLIEVNPTINFVDFNNTDLLKNNILQLIRSNTLPLEIKNRVNSFADFENYKTGVEKLIAELF